MKILAVLASSFVLGSAFGALNQAPPSFTYKDARVVYVDFESANYSLVFDVETKTATVATTISFQSPKEGYPLFDLVVDPSDVTLDGKAISAPEIQDPDHASTFRVMDKRVRAGKHTLTLRHVLTNNVVFNEDAVAAGFWNSDLNERRYLEQYLPTNFEYDQYKMDLKVQVVNSPMKHVLKANGIVTDLGNNSFQVSYPKFYSASSSYFHLFRDNTYVNNAQFYLKSIDGRMIPVDIYTIYDVQPFVDRATDVFHELEADYGPWPHNQLIIYGNAPSGGMEHSGATITALSAVAHEMFHSYHARGLMPANGNAGWMDEAIARWRDNKSPLAEGVTFSSTRLAGRTPFTRMTDRMAYTEGSAFLSWIAYRMNEKGLSFKTFLRQYFEKYKYTTVTTPLFQSEVTAASGLDLRKDFDRYIYGKSIHAPVMKSIELPENPMHPRFTEKQLRDLTWL
jgi:hypothetical protein